MIFLCPFLHCKALRTAMYKHYINSIIIIIIIIIIKTYVRTGLGNLNWASDEPSELEQISSEI